MLKQAIGISSEALSEKYMDLPTVVGRSKDGTIKYVKESAKGKVSGWKGQGLSKMAREVLIKSGLQASYSYFHYELFSTHKENVREPVFYIFKLLLGRSKW